MLCIIEFKVFKYKTHKPSQIKPRPTAGDSMSALSISFSAIPSDSINDLPIQIHIIQSMPEDVVECPVMERKKIKHEFKEKLFSLVREKRAFKIKAKADLLDLDKQTFAGSLHFRGGIQGALQSGGLLLGGLQ